MKCALIVEGGERDAALSRLVDDLNAAGVRIKYVPRAQLDALSSHGAHQGIALEVGNFPMLMSPIFSTAQATVRRLSSCSTM
ncbi:MAG: RNA methyltransferase substrate-binding domain-containing protein [Collinsella sp.]